MRHLALYALKHPAELGDGARVALGAGVEVEHFTARRGAVAELRLRLLGVLAHLHVGARAGAVLVAPRLQRHRRHAVAGAGLARDSGVAHVREAARLAPANRLLQLQCVPLRTVFLRTNTSPWCRPARRRSRWPGGAGVAHQCGWSISIDAFE